MPNWYASREAVKRFARQSGAAAIGDDRNLVIDEIIEASSRSIDHQTNRIFLPVVAAKSYRWPRERGAGESFRLWLDHDLVSVDSLVAGGVTIAGTDYFLEPNEFGPPYDRVEIDLSSSAAFASGDTPQRSIVITGSWGYPATTKAAGTITSGLSASAAATSMVCSNAALIDVGDTLLIGSEQIFVSERAPVTTTATITAVDGDPATVTVPVSDGTKVNAGETILVDSEKMFVLSVTANNLSVMRGFDATQIAAHSTGAVVYAYRTLTLVRGLNGTTAAVHADSAAISKYAPYQGAVDLTIANTISDLAQSDASWVRMATSTSSKQTVFGSSGLAMKWKTFIDGMREPVI